MIDMTRVYYMTEAAVFEKNHKNDAIDIVTYRRKDYILLHMLIVLLSVTVAYALLVASVLFMVLMAREELLLNVTQMAAIALGVILLYVIILIIYFIIAYKYYGEKHVKARQEITEYLDILNDLRDYENAKRTLDEIK